MPYRVKVKMFDKKDKPMPAIIFDLDGTLIDSVGDIHAALNQMLEKGYAANKR